MATERLSMRQTREILSDLNARPMRLYRASRRELFERLDHPALRPLPAEAFVYSDWKVSARVSIDYHIELHGHYYSVPYALIHDHVDAPPPAGSRQNLMSGGAGSGRGVSVPLGR